MNRLVHSIEKYRSCNVSEVWLVILLTQALIFMKPLTMLVK